MAANLSNIAFFDISEDQFKNFIPGNNFQSGTDYYGYSDSDIQGDEYLSTICNFAIQIDVDKKITLGRLGEFFMKSNSFWNLLNKHSDIGQGVSWYESLKTNISNIETLIGPQNDVSDSWDWNDIILKYNNLIELIYNITGIIGGLGDSNDPAENYKTWNTWNPFNQELETSGQDILGSIQTLYKYLTDILGSNWFEYTNARGGLNQRVTELENYTGIPITGASGQTSLKKQIEDINTALGKKSDEAGTDTVYGRLNQLETIKDSSVQLSDTIGGFSTGISGDPLTNKVNDLKTKKVTIHDIYQYIAPQTYDPDSDSFNTEGGNLDLPKGNNMVSALFKDSLFPAVYIKDTREVNIDWGHTYIMDSYYSPNLTSVDVVKKFFVLALPDNFTDKITVNSLNVVIPKLILPAIPKIEGSTSIKSLYNLNRIKIYVRGIGSISGESSIGLYGIQNVFPVGYIVNDNGKTILANFYSNRIVNLLSTSLSVSPVIKETNNLFTSNDNSVHTLFDIKNIGDGTFLNGGVVGFPYINISPSGLAFILARMAIIDIWYNPAAPGDIHWSMQLIFPTHSAVGVPRIAIELPQKTQ